MDSTGYPMSDSKIYPATATLTRSTHLNKAQYETLYAESINSPATFWPRMATDFLDWLAPFDSLQDCDMAKGEISWFINGKLNVSVNCIDRHLPHRAEQIAILWEGDEPGMQRSVTYQQMHDEVCKLANVLQQRGVTKGDRVCIYMPMIPEAAF